ncbi:MAG TPA: tetratricopeptide repeat protein [Xanthobacteraceae bacterium]|nr:tetratricopeptide repeat protein [Xanthobacteraceae bacterium]
MTDPSPRNLRIRELDRALARNPDAIDARCERAGLLREEGRFEEAKRDYLELLRRTPTDFGALNDFGTLVLNAGYTEAARSLFGEAVRHHPDNPNGHINLANLLLLIGELERARVHFEATLRIDPDHRHAHRGMGNLLAEIGDAAAARRHRDKAFKNHFLTTLPYRGDGPGIAILLLVAAAGGNIPTASLLDDRQFRTTVLVAEYADPRVALPRHDLVFNSIGDADLCRDGLKAACAVIARTDRPVINHPRAVLKSGRAANVERLRGLPNVVVPRMLALPRRQLAGADAAAVAAAAGFTFPFLVRAPGFHTGRFFVRVEDARQLAAAIAEFPAADVWLIEELDARDGDGFFRKCRVMLVDRKIYPLHLAISRRWKVHYFRADMADCADNRAKDAAFLDDMAGVVGARGMAALERINATLDLDYGGIDFAVNARGDILLFEANATMVMVPLTADPKWDYRRPAFDNVFAAVRKMLAERLAQPDRDQPSIARASGG